MAGHVFDYSGWRPDPASLVAAGVVGVCRYVASPSQAWKTISKVEYDQLQRAGMPVTLNWEESAGSWRGGFPVGRTHGAMARDFARRLGHPDERPIIQSIDTAVTPGELATAIDYQRGFNDGGGRGPQGVYGTAYVIDSLFALGLVRVGWQAAARGWYGNGPQSTHAAILQLTSKSYPQFPPAAYDENLPLMADWGQHPMALDPAHTCLFGYPCPWAAHP
jgi:hypothetical protein